MKRIALMLAFLTTAVSLASADPIEDFFAERGPWDTYVDRSTGPGDDFYLFVPKQLGQDGFKHPVITWGNGTFARPVDYYEFLDHLASHGFVVIAANDFFTGSGAAMLQGVDWLLDQNADPSSPLFDTLDPDAIGATGHSQGGQGTINAGNDPRVACTAPIQGVAGNVDGLQGPMFATAGENDRIVPARLVADEIYRPARVPSILGVLRGANHMDPLEDGDGFRGYVTAWFAACLEGDPFALDAFVGPCSLCQNPDWVVYRKRGQ